MKQSQFKTDASLWSTKATKTKRKKLADSIVILMPNTESTSWLKQIQSFMACRLEEPDLNFVYMYILFMKYIARCGLISKYEFKLI